MECERCRKDKQVQRYDIDGFSGYLCTDCKEAWDRIQTKE
jgi:transposase-like protein